MKRFIRKILKFFGIKRYIVEAILTPASRFDLVKWWTLFRSPFRDNIYCHHMTVAYGLTRKQLCYFNDGEPAVLRITGSAEDEFCQAVSVERHPETRDKIEQSLFCRNKHPHITISTSFGTPPVYSNKLLDNPEVRRDREGIKSSLFLCAIVRIRKL